MRMGRSGPSLLGSGEFMDEREEMIARIEVLRAEVAELESNIPAHSTSISHIAQIEELEDEIEELERALNALM